MEEIQQLKNKKADRQAIFFVIKLLFFYFLFSQGNLFMNSVFSQGGRFHNEYLATHFNYIQAIKSALIVPAVWIIKLFGFYAIHNEMDIKVIDGPLLRVNYACLGIGVVCFLTAFVIAFPAKLKAKWKLLVFGIILIYLLNVFRIVALGVLLALKNSSRSDFTYHHEIFNIIVYLILFAVIYYWIKKNTDIVLKK